MVGFEPTVAELQSAVLTSWLHMHKKYRLPIIKVSGTLRTCLSIFRAVLSLQSGINNTISSFMLIYRWVHETKAQLAFIEMCWFTTFTIEAIPTIHCSHVFFLSGTMSFRFSLNYIVIIARKVEIVNYTCGIKSSANSPNSFLPSTHNKFHQTLDVVCRLMY